MKVEEFISRLRGFPQDAEILGLNNADLRICWVDLVARELRIEDPLAAEQQPNQLQQLVDDVINPLLGDLAIYDAIPVTTRDVLRGRIEKIFG